MRSTRKPAVAGAFYPGEAEELKDMIDRFLSEAEDVEIPGKLRALIVPHAGYVYSGPVAAYGYKLLAKQAGISRIILIGPSHFAGFFGTAETDADKWQTPLGSVRAGSIKDKIKDLGMIAVIPEAHAPEHNIEVQVPFLQVVMKDDFTIYPLLTGDIRPAALADELENALDDKTLIIISSDLSHYFPYDKAVKLDTVTNNAIKTLDIKTLDAKGDACGKTGILVLLHIAKKRGWNCKLLNYRNSGDTAGPKNEVVGYSCFAFYEE